MRGRISHPELLVATPRLIYPAEHWGCVAPSCGLGGMSSSAFSCSWAGAGSTGVSPCYLRACWMAASWARAAGGTLLCVWPSGGWGHI